MLFPVFFWYPVRRQVPASHPTLFQPAYIIQSLGWGYLGGYQATSWFGEQLVAGRAVAARFLDLVVYLDSTLLSLILGRASAAEHCCVCRQFADLYSKVQTCIVLLRRPNSAFLFFFRPVGCYFPECCFLQAFLGPDPFVSP